MKQAVSHDLVVSKYVGEVSRAGKLGVRIQMHCIDPLVSYNCRTASVKDHRLPNHIMVFTFPCICDMYAHPCDGKYSRFQWTCRNSPRDFEVYSLMANRINSPNTKPFDYPNLSLHPAYYYHDRHPDSRMPFRSLFHSIFRFRSSCRFPWSS